MTRGPRSEGAVRSNAGATTQASAPLASGAARWLLAGVAASLLAAIAGGLLRLDVDVVPGAGAWLAPAARFHAALMIGGVFGTVIGLERAVALRARWALVTPLASALGALFLIAGREPAGAALLVAASAGFVAMHVLLLRRARAAHTLLLSVGALAWLAGNVLFATDASATAAIAFWFAFLVLTIAAERLEMMRLARTGAAARIALAVIVAALLAGAAATVRVPVAGGALYGGATAALGAWLIAFDIARRTVRAPGLSRYMALCLLAGHFWLAIAGLAWAGTALGLPLRDVALHALGLGFVFSMLMGHAPVIVPAVSGLKLRFRPWFYAAPVLLHASLVVRLAFGANDLQMRTAGAILNAAAIAIFVVTIAFAVRRRAPGAGRRTGPRR